MAKLDQESFNKRLYDLLDLRGFNPIPLDHQGKPVTHEHEADIFKFEFTKDGKSYGNAYATIDDASQLILYFGEEQTNSPTGLSNKAMGYDDSWHGFLKHLKKWMQKNNFHLHHN